MNNEQEKDFRDFWFETGKYEHRHTGVDVYIEYINNLLQETSLDQYAMGQSEGMEYHEFKIKELKEKVEGMKKDPKYELKGAKAIYEMERDGYNQALTDILNLLSSK